MTTIDLKDINIATYLAVYAFGVATSFTPCVYPLLPIITGVVGSSKENSAIKNFFVSLAYVLGMSIVFSILGVLAALTGKMFGQFQSSPAANIIVGSIIIVFSLSLMGVVTLPTFLLNRLGAGKVMKGGTIFSSFFMGAASGLIAAPCTTAVLGALLAYVSSTQNVVLGFSPIFTFAIGLGTLLILVGTFAGIVAIFPKNTVWMERLSKIMAFLMLIIGCYFIFKAGTLSI